MKVHKTAMTISTLIAFGWIFLCAICYKADKYTTDREKFDKCIEAHPSDWVCDSCWNAIMVKK